MDSKKSPRINFRLRPVARERLDELAEERGETRTKVIEDLILNAPWEAGEEAR